MTEAKKLYYFTSAKYALEAIKYRHLKIAELDKVNDPYETLAVAFDDRKEESDVLAARKGIASVWGVVCFSEIWNDPLLWGHYGDKGQGICLGFDVDKGISANVIYNPERINNDMMSELYDSFSTGKLKRNDDNTLDSNFKTQLGLLFLTKSERWNYEKECRVWSKLKQRDPVTQLYFYHFGNQMRLREILIGFRCDEKNIKSRLTELVRDDAYSSDPPKIVLTRRSLTKFEIEKVI